MKLIITVQLEDEIGVAIKQLESAASGVIMAIQLMNRHKERDVLFGVIEGPNGRPIGRISLMRQNDKLNLN